VGANKCDQFAKGCLAATLLRDSEVGRILNRVARALEPWGFFKLLFVPGSLMNSHFFSEVGKER
jgi:hypothetical protein